MTKQFDQVVIDALASARRSIRKIEDLHTLPTKQHLFEIAYLVRSFSTLDAAGVFADLDEQADTPKAESIAAVMRVEDDEDLTLSGRIVNVLRDAREIYNTPGKERSEGWWDGAIDYVLTGEGRSEDDNETPGTSTH